MLNYYVQQLSNGINQSHIHWKDSKYQSIREAIGNFAQESRKVFSSVELCNRSLRKFEDYLEE